MLMTTFKLICFCIVINLTSVLVGQSNTDPIVMQIGTDTVRLSEFEYIYKKNLSIESVEQVSFEEYINMFKDYKLKILEAKRLGLDKTVNFRRELDVYKAILDISKDNQELSETEYKHLIHEYEEGILLFDISNEKIWNKTNHDQKGLERYFIKNKAKYKLQEAHFKGYIAECKNEATATKIKQLIKSTNPDSLISLKQSIYNKNEETVRINHYFVKYGENKHIDLAIFEQKGFSPDSKFPFMSIEGKIIQDYPENYKDIKGQITYDYQNYLDRQWIKELNKKYKIIIYHDIIKTVKED